jgi:hypothetical protein
MSLAGFQSKRRVFDEEGKNVWNVCVSGLSKGTAVPILELLHDRPGE